MNNEKISGRKIGSIVIDIITIGLLFASFGMVFYSCFISEQQELKLSWMAIITAVGLSLLFGIGTCSCMVSKVKSSSLTAGFLAFSAVQLYALLSNFVVLAVLLLGIGSVEGMYMRAAYIITAAIVLIGYVVDVFSFSGNDDIFEYEDDDDEYDDDDYEPAEDEEVEEDDSEYEED